MQWMHTHSHTHSHALAHIAKSRLSHLHIFFSLCSVWLLLVFVILRSNCSRHRFLVPTFFSAVVIPTCNSTRFISVQRIFFISFWKFCALCFPLWLSIYEFQFVTHLDARVSLRFFFNVCLICIGRVDFLGVTFFINAEMYTNNNNNKKRVLFVTRFNSKIED